jgi:transposase InsO family protein
MNKSSALIKYKITVVLGLIDVGYTNFIQVVIQNTTDGPLTLQKGTAVCQLLIMQSEIPNLKNFWPELKQKSRGAFGSTGQNFETTKSKTLEVDLVRIDLPDDALFRAYDKLNNNTFRIDNLNIHLIETPENNSQIMFNIQTFEAELIAKELDAFFELPEIPEILLNNNTIEEEYPLTQQSLEILLANELAENKKLTVESLIYYQNNDQYIKPIKESLLMENSHLKTFVLKKNVVCKLFKPSSTAQLTHAVYIPSVLLLPTIIYVHKHFLHPSRTQTFKEFASLYYHPHAKKMVKKICDSCLTCKMTKNPEIRDQSVGRTRSTEPSGPRKSISMDILYLPTSSKGHTHALLISDMYSSYVSFFPLKGKSSETIATALRSFISLQGIPEHVYSDNDPSFQGAVEQLLTSFNIKHSTSYAYSQWENQSESQVRRIKNAFRSAITSNPIFTHREWHILYPLVIIRLNTLISKYGISREMVHYMAINENHLPLIVDIKLDSEIEDDLDALAYKFQGKLRKYLRNKRKSKSYYKTGKDRKFLLHELVMRRHYTASSPLHSTYVGPYRIKEVHPKGCTLKDPRTGEICSVHEQNLRKLSINEFLELLPTNFDHEILKHLDLYRYNRNEEPDKIKSKPLPEKDEFHSLEIAEEKDNKEEEGFTDPYNIRKLRNGKIIKLYSTFSGKFPELEIRNSMFTPKKVKYMGEAKTKPILSHKIRLSPTPYADFLQKWDGELWSFSTTLTPPQFDEKLLNYKSRHKSRFQSPYTGTLQIDLEPEPILNKAPFKKKVNFTKITVHFY